MMETRSKRTANNVDPKTGKKISPQKGRRSKQRKKNYGNPEEITMEKTSKKLTFAEDPGRKSTQDPTGQLTTNAASGKEPEAPNVEATDPAVQANTPGNNPDEGTNKPHSGEATGEGTNTATTNEDAEAETTNKAEATKINETEAGKEQETATPATRENANPNTRDETVTDPQPTSNPTTDTTAAPMQTEVHNPYAPPKEATYAEAVNNNAALYTPTTHSLPTSIRFKAQVAIAPTEQPLEEFATNFKKVFKEIQKTVGTFIHLGPWDAEMEGTHKIIKKPSEFPNGKTKHPKADLSAYISGYFNPQAKGGVNYFRVRWIHANPKKHQVDIRNLGELVKDAFNGWDFHANIAKAPIPCQATKTLCIGWLYGSTKTISEKSFVPAVRAALKLPDTCEIGVQWRSIRDSNGKLPPFDRSKDSSAHPQALHLDMDERYAGIYESRASALWTKSKKGNKRLPNDIRLRLIPCFGNLKTRGNSTERTQEIQAMAEKQHYLQLKVIKRHNVPFVKFLDKALSDTNPVTLRKAMMARAPKDAPTARIIHNVDLAWNSTINVVVTATQSNQDMATEYTNSLIPEILHRYGEKAKTWFTAEGLHIYEGIEWDPVTQKTQSEKDAEQAVTYQEDLYGIGDEWKQLKKEKTERPKKDETSPTQEGEKQDTDKSTKKTTTTRIDGDFVDDSDTRSFASQYGRTSDDAPTVQGTDQTTRSGAVVQIDQQTLDQLEAPKDTSQESDTGNDPSVATGKGTTGTTRRALEAATDELGKKETLLEEQMAKIAELEARLQNQMTGDRTQTETEITFIATVPPAILDLTPMETSTDEKDEDESSDGPSLDLSDMSDEGDSTARSKTAKNKTTPTGEPHNAVQGPKETSTNDAEDSIDEDSLDLDSHTDNMKTNHPEEPHDAVHGPKEPPRNDDDEDSIDFDNNSNTSPKFDTDEIMRQLHYGTKKTRSQSRQYQSSEQRQASLITPQAHNPRGDNPVADGPPGSVGTGD